VRFIWIDPDVYPILSGFRKRKVELAEASYDFRVTFVTLPDQQSPISMQQVREQSMLKLSHGNVFHAQQQCALLFRMTCSYLHESHHDARGIVIWGCWRLLRRMIMKNDLDRR
jgi:hypothetical protein